MPRPAVLAAKRLCERSGWGLSNLELQKLLYLAHMAYLGRTVGRPLILESFEAWDLGPVVPALYHRAKAFGSGPVQNVFHHVTTDLQPDETSVIDGVYQGTRGLTPGQLVAITHWDGGAWAKHYSPRARGNIIPNKDILDEYRARVRNAG
jgi:uncharacterized phage-associated protein